MDNAGSAESRGRFRDKSDERGSQHPPTASASNSKTRPPQLDRIHLEISFEERQLPKSTYRTWGKPKSTLLVLGSGHRLVTTLPRV